MEAAPQSAACGAGAPDQHVKVKITPQMMEAGASVLRHFLHEEPSDDFSEVAALVFRAMVSVAASERG